MTNNLGKLLRKARKDRGLKLRQVAEALNKSAAYICDLENNRRGKNMSPKLAMAIAAYLRIPVNIMLEASGNAVNEETVAYKQYLRATKSAETSTMIGNTIHAVQDVLVLLHGATSAGTEARKYAKKAAELIRVLDSAIRM